MGICGFWGFAVELLDLALVCGLKIPLVFSDDTQCILVGKISLDAGFRGCSMLIEGTKKWIDTCVS